MRTNPKHGGRDNNPVNFRCSDTLLKVIKQYQDKKHLHSNSEAIRKLIMLGITYDYTESLDD